jgi:hypothetical protein
MKAAHAVAVLGFSSPRTNAAPHPGRIRMSGLQTNTASVSLSNGPTASSAALIAAE